MATTTKKTVAKRATATPATEVIEGVVVDMSDEQAELLALADNRTAAAAYAKRKIDEYHADILTGERAVVKASWAAYGAVFGGYAVEGKDSPEAGQITLDDLGAMLAEGVAKRYDEKTGKYKPYSKAMVSGWRNAGEAYAKGVDPDSTLGRALVARYAQFGDIRKAIAAPDMTVEKVQKAVDKKKDDEKKNSSTTSNTTTTTTTPEPKTPRAKIEAALAGLSKDEARTLLTEVIAWVDSEEFGTPAAEETPAA